jgi:hypothetical protein
VKRGPNRNKRNKRCKGKTGVGESGGQKKLFTVNGNLTRKLENCRNYKNANIQNMHQNTHVNTGRKTERYRLGTVSGSYTKWEFIPALGAPNLTYWPKTF